MEYAVLLQLANSLLKKNQQTTGRQIVQFKDAYEYSKCLKTLKQMKSSFKSLEQIHPIRIIHSFLFPFYEPLPIQQFSHIKCIEHDTRVSIHAASPPKRKSVSAIPWGVKQIKAPLIWKKTTGKGIKVGVIDTGINYYHPALKNAIGRGINLLNRYELPMDDNGHGTHIAGTISAYAKNNMIGVAPGVTIHPVKAFDYNGSAYISDIIMGLEWCIQNRMNVINMSFGMKEKSNTLLQAIQKSVQAGCILVASSGNDGARGKIDYPAHFSETISVSATTQNRKIAKFSNRSKAVDLYAPGERIRSTWLRDGYHELSGTSMATSHVSGVIALMLSLRPRLSSRLVKLKLKRAATALNMKTKKPLPGEVNALKAVRSLRSVKPKKSRR